MKDPAPMEVPLSSLRTLVRESSVRKEMEKGAVLMLNKKERK